MVWVRPDGWLLFVCATESDTIPEMSTPCRSKLSVSKSDRELPFRVLPSDPGPHCPMPEKLFVSVLSEELLSVSSLTTDN